jgi:hypothetical protein
MAACAKRIGYGVPKDGHNQHQKYDFTSSANVRLRCGVAMGEERIAVSSALAVLCSEQRMSATGKPQNHVEVLATLTFYDADSGESISVQGLGCGTDSGDKAPMKAVTAAEKYAYISAFTLAMGEDPEQDAEHDGQATAQRNAPTPPSPAQVEATDAMRAELKLLMSDVRSAEDLHAWFRGAYPLLGKVPSDVASTSRTMITRRAAALGVDNDTIAGWADAIRKGAA